MDKDLSDLNQRVVLYAQTRDRGHERWLARKMAAQYGHGGQYGPFASAWGCGTLALVLGLGAWPGEPPRLLLALMAAMVVLLLPILVVSRRHRERQEAPLAVDALRRGGLQVWIKQDVEADERWVWSYWTSPEGTPALELRKPLHAARPPERGQRMGRQDDVERLPVLQEADEWWWWWMPARPVCVLVRGPDGQPRGTTPDGEVQHELDLGLVQRQTDGTARLLPASCTPRMAWGVRQHDAPPASSVPAPPASSSKRRIDMLFSAWVACDCVERGRLRLAHPVPHLLRIGESGEPELDSTRVEDREAHWRWELRQPCEHMAFQLVKHTFHPRMLHVGLDAARRSARDPEQAFPVLVGRLLLAQHRPHERIQPDEAQNLASELRRLLRPLKAELRAEDLKHVGGFWHELLVDERLAWPGRRLRLRRYFELHDAFRSRLGEMAEASVRLHKPIVLW